MILYILCKKMGTTQAFLYMPCLHLTIYHPHHCKRFLLRNPISLAWSLQSISCSIQTGLNCVVNHLQSYLLLCKSVCPQSSLVYSLQDIFFQRKPLNAKYYYSYYHSIFDDSTSLNYTYGNRTTIPPDSIQAYLTKVSTMLAHSLYEHVTGQPYVGAVVANETLVSKVHLRTKISKY